MPSSRLWQLVNAPPGNTTLWPKEDMWAVSYPQLAKLANFPTTMRALGVYDQVRVVIGCVF